MPRARLHRDGQVGDLHAGIVVVELAFHVPAAGIEQAAQAVADDGIAAVAHVQRAGRIGGDEFHAHGLAGAVGIAAVGVALGQDAAHFGVIGVGGEEEVDEAGAGDLDLVHQRVCRQRGDQFLGQLARFGARRFGQQQRHVAGEIAVVAVARPLDHEPGQAQVGRQGEVVLQALNRLQHQFAQLFFHGGDRFRNGTANPNRGPAAEGATGVAPGAVSVLMHCRGVVVDKSVKNAACLWREPSRTRCQAIGQND